LKNNEILIDNEKLQIVLDGISEMTTEIETQRNLLNNLIENKFRDIIERNSTNEQILENTKQYVKSKLELKIEGLNKVTDELAISNKKLIAKQKDLSYQIDKNKKDADQKIQHITKKENDASNKLLYIQKENESLKEMLRKKFIDDEMRKWERQIYFLIPFIIIIIIFFYFQLFHCEWKYNYVQKLIEYIDNNPSETKRDWMRWIVNGGLGAILAFLLRSCSKVICKKKKSEKRKEIENNIPLKYK